MSRAHFEEREKFKRFVGASISKPKLEEEEEFNKFLNDLSCCVLMNRKGFEPFLCDFYEWSQQANEPETVEILMAPSGVMPGKATTIRAKLRYGVLKAKPGSAAKDPYYPAGVGLKTVGHFEPSAIGYYRHPRSKPKYRILNKEVIRAEAEKASRSYLTPEMNSLLNAINNSRSLLELEDNWDGEGSVGYDESTWLRARNFLMRNAVRLYESQKKCFDPPEILPGPKGSIDLHWKTEARELLINVPADSQETISYYGDDTAENTENAIRGQEHREFKKHRVDLSVADAVIWSPEPIPDEDYLFLRVHRMRIRNGEVRQVRSKIDRPKTMECPQIGRNTQLPKRVWGAHRFPTTTPSFG